MPDSDIEYISNERSHLELIRRDFDASRRASVMRHNQSLLDRPLLTWSRVVEGIAAAMIVILVLIDIKLI